MARTIKLVAITASPVALLGLPSLGGCNHEQADGLIMQLPSHLWLPISLIAAIFSTFAVDIVRSQHESKNNKRHPNTKVLFRLRDQ